jgi:hypothetical protein
LPENLCSKLIVALRVSRFVLPDKFIELIVNVDICLHKLSPETIQIHASTGISLNRLGHHFLIMVNSLPSISIYTRSFRYSFTLGIVLSPVMVEIVGVHRWLVTRVSLGKSPLIVVQAIGNLGVVTFAVLGSSDVGLEFSSSWDSDILNN